MPARMVLPIAALCSLLLGCGNGVDTGPRAASSDPPAPRDAQHQNVVGPHGDHTPRHGGMVLMNGDVHYEVVLANDGRHEVWFSDAVRNDLPASVATGVVLEMARPGLAAERLQLTINDTGEAWVARGRPVEGKGDGVMVTLRYALQGEPHEVELPFVPATAPLGR